MRLPAPVRAMRLAPVLLMLASCSAGERIGPSFALKDYVSGVQSKDGSVIAAYFDGAPPAATTTTPALQVSGINSVVNGGSAQNTLTSTTAFTRVVVSIVGYGGYYELTLPAAASSSDVLVTLTTNVAAGSIPLQYQAGTATALGPAVTQTLRSIRVGNGDIQVSIAWSGATDIDLHVTDPSGEEIFYGNKVATSGGKLDLDSNPACSIDGKNNENVVWPTGKGATGSYTIQVVYYSDCGQARSDWVVTALVKGKAAQTFTGSFVGAKSANPAVTLGPITY